MHLRLSDIEFEPASYVDPNGRVFRWNGGLYRAISSTVADAYRRLLESPAATALIERGLIETEITSLRLEGYDLVLRHREISVRSYPFEWPATMLRDTALLTLDLAEQLRPLGFDLQDANPYNVLFDGVKLVFVDFGSLTPARTDGPMRATRDFVQCFVNPLYLLTRGHADTARNLMRDPTRWGARANDVTRDATWRDRLHYAWRITRRLPAANAGWRSAIAALRSMIDDLRVPEPSTEWSTYYREVESLDAPDTWSLKQKTAADLLRQFQPRTVLDVGSNAGWFSKLAAREGAQVIAVDRDETCINQLYRDIAAKTGVAPIVPLVQDFATPSPAHGPNGVFPDAFARFRSEMVLCLALTHHLVFKAGLDFGRIADTLDRYTDRQLLVEFVPADDKYVAEWVTPDHGWYTLDNFRAEFERRFDRVTVLPSNRSPRVLLLCERLMRRAA